MQVKLHKRCSRCKHDSNCKINSDIESTVNTISQLRHSYVDDLIRLRASYGPKIAEELENLRKLVKSL
jgi:hypothetical protein